MSNRTKPIKWKKGRGKLGILAPIMGTWRAEAESEMGPVVCVRTFEKALGGAYIQLTAHWEAATYSYDEFAFYGVGDDKQVHFWSFTSDGKRSDGVLVEAPDVHPAAIAFEAEMDAGRARMVYWPDEEEGYHWAVENLTKKGWNRFLDHHYKAVER